ncbi:hypothetical protein [Natronorubrum daqingense]|uniref:Uncharacterized protein n=1 Tax=Natronorubrum daqingense TaxID=588898 RepID=A0A1N7A784_9EURY|nr:hypothetical protein [Natronorubrum daqingense]APX95116.1 hypothetical protein BB347_00050 [Natronorubrum daqingense]SIR35000.1 hypothetical protein SAMN05421809_1058 [Natronorubrum daqingense]
MGTDLPAALAESWHPIGTKTGESSVLVASIHAETTVYGPTEPADGIESLELLDIPPRSLFTVDLSISPSLSAVGVSPESVFSKAAPKAKSQFVETLEDEGLVVEETRNTLEFEATNGAAGAWYVLDAGYPVPLDGDDRSTTLGVEAHVAVWPLEETFGMAGGIVPLEANEHDAGSSKPEQKLEIAPGRDRETIAKLIRTVDP